jgi:hypothetical protein
MKITRTYTCRVCGALFSVTVHTAQHDRWNAADAICSRQCGDVAGTRELSVSMA